MKKTTIGFSLFLLMLTCQLQAQNILKTGIYQVLPNTEFDIQLIAENSSAFSAFQVDIPVPTGFTYVAGSAILNASRISGHALSASLIDGNILRLIGYSVGNSPFLGNSGTLVSFKFKTGSVPGSNTLALNQAMLGNSESNNILTGSTNGSVTVLAPNISLSISKLDYGRLPLGTAAEKSFQITNTGNTDLVIQSLNFSNAQFSTTDVPGFTIAPQTSHTVTVKLTATTPGNYVEKLQIGSNDPDQATTTVVLNATPYSVNEIHPGNITGASTTIKTLEFTLNNVEACTGIQFDIILPKAITYVAGTAQLFRNQDQIISVNQVTDQTLRVLVFSPGNKNITGNAGKILSLDFLINGVAGYSTIQTSQVIIASTAGKNVVSDLYNGQLSVTASDIDGPGQLTFPELSVLSNATVMYRILNRGGEVLNISQLIFSTSYVSSSQVLPVSINPSGYLDIPVTCTNPVKGSYNATLKIVSNDPDENPFVVQLTGHAFVPNYMLINNQNFFRGESKVLAVEVENPEPFVAMQFDLSYPLGFTPDLNGVTLTNRKQDHVVTAIALSATSTRILVYSPGQKEFTGQSGPVVDIPFHSESGLGYGSYNLTFSNALISDMNSENILYASRNGLLNVQVVTDTKPQLSSAAFQLYPNPASESFQVTGIPGKSWLRLTNIQGKEMFSKQVESNEPVSIGHLAKGVYLVKIITGEDAFECKVLKK